MLYIYVFFFVCVCVLLLARIKICSMDELYAIHVVRVAHQAPLIALAAFFFQNGWLAGSATHLRANLTHSNSRGQRMLTPSLVSHPEKKERET